MSENTNEPAGSQPPYEPQPQHQPPQQSYEPSQYQPQTPPQPPQSQAPPQPPQPGAYPAPGGYPAPGAAPYATSGASPYAPAPSNGAGGIAIAALIVGIAAFLTGIVPVLGFIVAAVGIVLGIIAVRRPQGRGLSITGLILSGIGLVTSIVVALVLFVFLPAGLQQGADELDAWVDEQTSSAPSDESGTADGFDEATYSVVSGQPIETPCWSYDGPQYFTNNISQDAVDACIGKLELWGEIDGDGNVTPTGVGAIFGQVGVEPVRVSTAEGYAPGTDPVAVVDALEDSYFGAQGTVISLHEPAQLGGVAADITRVDSETPETQTKAFITAYAPSTYDIGGEEAQLFIISIVTPYGNGDELIQQVLDTWEWK